MKISVTKEENISNLQDQFNALYPFLRIEFYAILTALENSRRTKPFMSPRFKLGDSRMGPSQLEIMVSDEMTVFELEEKLYESFGLYAEVLRKSGNIWLETTLTSNWTLLQQNNMGASIS